MPTLSTGPLTVRSPILTTPAVGESQAGDNFKRACFYRSRWARQCETKLLSSTSKATLLQSLNGPGAAVIDPGYVLDGDARRHEIR